MESVIENAKLMKKNAPLFASSSLATRNRALVAVKEALIKNKESIFAANKIDVDNAVAKNTPKSVLKRLIFDEDKLKSVCDGIDTLVGLDDPLGEITLNRKLSEGLILKRVSVPIGVIGVIFEARPDALIQIAALCIKSGNMCILKGGKETVESNSTISRIVYEAAYAAADGDFPEGFLHRVSSHDEIDELLMCEGYVDLIIPRGSNAFVKHIMDSTNIPVLGHADGVCHTYIDKSANEELALKVCLDAKTQYPAACNATETILIHRDIAYSIIPTLSELFAANNVKMIEEGEVTNYHTEYLDLAVSVKVVDSIEKAVLHINKYGSHHTDAIITEDEASWKYFSNMVDSAGVYKNASTRFADGFRYGFGAEVGISTSKIHARGPVGLFGLCTYKYLLEGDGATVGDFESQKRIYLFEDL